MRGVIFRRICAAVAHTRVSLSTFQIIYSDYGDPRRVLKGVSTNIADKLGSNDVRVKLLMAPINPSDINMVEGTYFLKPPLPAVSGNEGVGEVTEVGPDVKRLKPGDWVIPSDSGWGTWREVAVAAESDLVKIANDIPVLGAATIAVNPCTAYRLLRDFCSLHPGDVLLQNGANSAVGQCVIQMAREMKVTTVNVVRNRPDLSALEAELRSLGASYVVTEEHFRSAEMRTILSGLPAPKLALNCVGGKSSTELIKQLGLRGVMVTYGGMSKQPVVVPTGSLIFRLVRLEGYWNTEWNRLHKASKVREEMLAEICSLLHSKKLLPPKSDLFPLQDFEKAVTQAMEGFKGNKKVLVMDRQLL